MFWGITLHFLGDYKFVREGSKFDLWFLRSIHFFLINCWRLGVYWIFSWWYWKYPNFQLVILKNLTFSCRENDTKMTNKYSWTGLEECIIYCPVPIVTPEIRLIALGYYRSLSLNDVSSKLDLDSFSISDKRSGPEEAVEVKCLG